MQRSLTFTIRALNNFDRLHIWSVVEGAVLPVTDPLFDVSSPVWDPEGNYLYYLSRREFAQISSIEWNYAGNRDLQIYALALRKDVKNPFAPSRMKSLWRRTLRKRRHKGWNR